MTGWDKLHFHLACSQDRGWGSNWGGLYFRPSSLGAYLHPDHIGLRGKTAFRAVFPLEGVRPRPSWTTAEARLSYSLDIYHYIHKGWRGHFTRGRRATLLVRVLLTWLDQPDDLCHPRIFITDTRKASWKFAIRLSVSKVEVQIFFKIFTFHKKITSPWD